MLTLRRLLVLSIVITCLAAASPGAAQDAPAQWTRADLPGGPVYDLAIGPVPFNPSAGSLDSVPPAGAVDSVRSAGANDSVRSDEADGLDAIVPSIQMVYSAGVDVQSTTRGDLWQHNPGTGPVVNARAGSGDVVFVADAYGRGYRSGNLGKDWGRVFLRSGDPPFRFVAVSPDYASDTTAYAITENEWRLYRTGNGGAIWSEVKVALGETHQIGAAAFSSLFGWDETSFIGTERGLYKWSVADQRWSLISAAGVAPAFGPEGGPLANQGIVVPAEYGDDPRSTDDPVVRTLFAFNTKGVYRSDDDGATWRTLALPAAVQQVNGLAVSPAWPYDPVLAIAVKGTGILGAVSWDDGATWSTIAGRDGMAGTAVAMSRDFGFIPRSIISLPALYRKVGVGSRAARVAAHSARPNDGIAQAAAPNLGITRAAAPNDGIAQAVGPKVPGTREAFLATDGDGVYRTRDAGRTWQPPHESFSGVAVTAITALGDSDDPVLAAGDAAGLYRSADGGATWQHLDSAMPRGHGQTVHALRLSPAFATDRTAFLSATSGLWVSRDGGATWTATPGPRPAHSLAVSPAFATDQTVLSDGHLSTDGGRTWQVMNQDFGATWTAAAFSPDYATDRTLYVGTDRVSPESPYGLFRSTDGGQSWKVVEESIMREAKVYSLLVTRFDPREPIRVLAGTSRGIQHSYDGGQTWRSASGGGGANTYDIAGVAVRTPTLYGLLVAATEDGAVWSQTRGVQWLREPRSARPTLSSTIPSDGAWLLVGAMPGVARYPLTFGAPADLGPGSSPASP